jgi:nucleotide-binding universal stress UspA family protein
MLAIKEILFPFDFSERSYCAAPFAGAMACRFGARLTLLSVAQPFYYSSMGEAGQFICTEEILQGLKLDLDNALIQEFAHLNVARIAVFGDPADVITDYAHTHGTDLIMMPTHGYGKFRTLLLGSVTAKVLHDAAGPVWTDAHLKELAPARSPGQCARILCAIDLTERSLRAIAYAAEFAEKWGATLRLVHVVPANDVRPEKYLSADFTEALSEMARQQIAKLQHEARTKAEVSIASGDIAQGVRETALEHQSDMIVIGRGVVRERLGRLRTQAYSIIRESPCPVLSV